LRSNPEVVAALDKMDADPFKDFDNELNAAIAATPRPPTAHERNVDAKPGRTSAITSCPNEPPNRL